MSIYTDLTAHLGDPFGSTGFQSFLGKLPPKKLRKDGGYRASLTFKREGIYLTFDWRAPEWLFGSAMLFSAGVDGFRGFGELIEGRLPIASLRGAVRDTLGAPNQTGGAGEALGVLTDYFWDRYDFERYHLRFDYESADGAVRLVSLMSPACARELNPDLAQT